MSIEGILVGAALSPVVMLVVAFAYRAVAVVTREAFGWLIVSHVVNSEGTAAIQDYFRGQRRLVTGGENGFWQMIYVYVRPEGAYRWLFHRSADGSNAVMFHHGAPIVHMRRETMNGTTTRYHYLRGTVDWEAVLRLAQADEVKRTHGRGNRYRVKRYFGSMVMKGTADYGTRNDPPPLATPANVQPGERHMKPLDYELSDIGPPNPPDPFRHLAFGDAGKQVVRDAKFWLDHQEWHQEREIPWRWGCLLKGGPGTGKTSLVRSTAQHLDLPVVVADLAGLSNRDLSEGLRHEIHGSTPCVLLLEDVDNVFHGRENVAGSSLTFDALLNFLDGVEGLDGVLTFVTTNRPETLDPALTRPGRLDSHVELPNLDDAGRQRVALLILQNDWEATKIAASAPPDESPAEFKERCCRRAREMLWETRG